MELPDWIDEIDLLKEKARNQINQEELIVFYGSSSIRLWENLKTDFSGFNVLNLGFGGSTYAWCNYFFEELFVQLHPVEIILYGGDNDLSNSTVEKATEHLKSLTGKILDKYRNVKISLISVKPSPERKNLENQIRSFNANLRNIAESLPDGHFINIHSLMLNGNGEAIKEFFTEDELHMNEKGYQIWKSTVMDHLKRKSI